MRLIILILSLIALPVRSAVLFDGSNDVLGFGTMGDAVFKENAPLSISLWFKATTLGEANSGVFMRRGTDRLLRVTATDAIVFNIAGATILTRQSANSVFALNTWTHLCLTWDGSTTAANSHIYINGTEVSYATTTDGATPTDNAAETLTIGNNNATSASFDGQMSDVFVSSFVLKVGDIANLSKSRTFGVPLMCSTATGTGWAYWPLWDFSDGATVTGAGTIRDLSPNAYHGTATNSPVAVASVVITGP